MPNDRRLYLESLSDDQRVDLGKTGKSTSRDYPLFQSWLSQHELEIEALWNRQCCCNNTEWEISTLLDTEINSNDYTLPRNFLTELQRGFQIENADGTWKFRAIKTGTYKINLTFWLDFDYFTEPIEDTVQMQSVVFKNGVKDRNIGWDWNTTDEHDVDLWFYNLSGTTSIFLEAGEYFDIRLFYGGTTPVAGFSIDTYANISVGYKGGCVTEQKNDITNNWESR